MKRFLSIVMMLCILCGMALPAAAAQEKCDAGCILPKKHLQDGTKCITNLEIEPEYIGVLDHFEGEGGLREYWWAQVTPSLYPDGVPEDATAEADYNDRTDKTLTVVLPKEYYPGFICNIVLPGKKNLTIQGSKNVRTVIEGTITLGEKSDNIKLDNLFFNSSNPAVELWNHNGTYTVSSCEFRGYDAEGLYAFISQNANGIGPKLALSSCNFATTNQQDNTVSNEMSILILDEYNPGDVVIHVETTTGSATLNLGIDAGYKDIVIGSQSVSWNLEYEVPMDPNLTEGNYYVVADGIWVGNAYVDNNHRLCIPYIKGKNEYEVIDDKAPVVSLESSKGSLEITDNHLEKIKSVQFTVPFSAATVTYGKDSVTAKVTDHVISFATAKAGTYVIKATGTSSTKKVTKPVTSSQSYYLITQAGFANAMRFMKDNTLSFDCSQAGRKPISLPVDSMASAAEQGLSVALKAKYYVLTLDAAALKSLAQQAKGTTVLVEYHSLNHKTLTTEAVTAVNNHVAQYPSHVPDLAFAVTAASDKESIVDLQRGTIRLTIPFIILPGTEGIPNESYALMADGTSESRITIVEDGYLTTVVQDLTEHMVFQKGDSPEPVVEETTETVAETTVETTQPETEPETQAVPETTAPAQKEKENGNLLLWLPIVVAVILAGFGAAAFLLLRKKK